VKKVILSFFFIPVPLFCQVADNFETGRIDEWVESTNNRWKADSTESINGKFCLYHVFDNPEAGNDQIGIALTDLKPSMGPASWSFKLRHGYDPSSSNNWGVFLISDSPPSSMIPGANVNGYIIGVNLTGYDDTLRLWKIKNGVLSQVVNTGINWQNNIGKETFAVLNIERSAEGFWKTSVFSNAGTLSASASGSDEELFNSEWFGIYYSYTSTRDRLLWVDDIIVNGVFYKDTVPPEVTSWTAKSLSSVDLTFDEEPEAGFDSPGNFVLNSISGTASEVIRLNQFTVRVIFNNSFINKAENTLLMKTLCDKRGNCNQNVLIRFTPVRAGPGDVIISEIMADPVPSVALPEKEYLEIYNRSGFRLNLKNWRLKTDVTEAVFPETILFQGEQLILCQPSDTSSFSRYGKVKGLKSFPALTDGGRLIVLTDSSGNMIHGVDYNPGWYGEKLKEEGGWSLEMIDTQFPFHFEGNWTASLSKNGGTPGTANSVSGSNPDLVFNGILNAFPNDSGYLEVSFSEPVKNLPENLAGILINEAAISSINVRDPLLRKFWLKPSVQFAPDQKYTLSLPPTVTDFADNRPETDSFVFGIPERPGLGDLTFNEILFNPLPGEADYIELYNSSTKIIDASELFFASISESGGYSSLVQVSGEHRLILPEVYYAVTIERESILNRYFSAIAKNVFTVPQLPSMPDDNGHLILFNRQTEAIDEVIYSEKMHNQLLSGYDGIALEKVRPQAPSTDPANWHSASEVSGWGTPGAPNSIFTPIPGTGDKIIFSSSRISPDNDGNNDLLVIDFNLEGSGNVLKIYIYDETGGFVCKLAENLLAGTKASVTWDGTARDGSVVRSGIYIFLITVFNDTGKVEKWKKVCTVVR
jgi:hypothetical protein